MRSADDRAQGFGRFAQRGLQEGHRGAQRVEREATIGGAAGGMIGVGEQGLKGATGKQGFKAGTALFDPFPGAVSRACSFSDSFQRKSGMPRGTAMAPIRYRVSERNWLVSGITETSSFRTLLHSADPRSRISCQVSTKLRGS